MQNNRIIAEFMGAKEIGQYLGSKGGYKDTILYEFIKKDKNEDLSPPILLKHVSDVDFKYHSDWNWLMPVIDKIESLGYWIELHSGAESVFIIGKLNTAKDLFSEEGKTKIEAAYNGVVEFIKHYNKHL